jgi:hypothetical protein
MPWQYVAKSGMGGYTTTPKKNFDRAKGCANFPTNKPQKILKKNFTSYFP